MDAYFSTYISGISSLIPKILKSLLDECEVKLNLDGLVLYTTKTTPNKIKSIKFFNNSFISIKHFENLNNLSFKPMERWALKQPFIPLINDYVKTNNIKSFRVIFSRENTIVSPNKTFRASFERAMCKSYKLKVDRVKPDVEFWFLIRNEGHGFIGFRITNNSKVEHRLKGQLRPELANILCLLSNPSKDDIFLDPFAGHGTIAMERLNYPAKEVMAIEKLEEYTKKIPNNRVSILNADFFKTNIESKSIDKIVTDPPWGKYDTQLSKDFYDNTWRKFHKILSTEGIVVILLEREYFEETNFKNFNFYLKESYNILVSGKKATIVVLQLRNVFQDIDS